MGKKKKKAKKKAKAEENLREILERFRGEATESVRAVWLAGLGALDAVDKESGRILEDWIAKGRELEGKTRSEVDQLLDRGEEWAGEIRERVAGRRREIERAVSQAVDRVGVPTQKDVDALSDRIARLEAEIARRRAAAEKKADQEAEPVPAAKKPSPRESGGAAKKPKQAKKKPKKAKKAEKKETAPAVWLVEPADDGWVVRRRDLQEAESRHATKKPAVDEARQKAKDAKGSLVLHRLDGSVQSEHTYDE